MFNTYEELMQVVEERREATLTLEVEMGGVYSQEHEDAKAALAQAQALKTLAGEQQFLNDNMEALEARVAETKPATPAVFLRYKKVSIQDWALLLKKQNMSAIDQYEHLLKDTFIGVYGTDPDPDEKPEGWVMPEPLSTDPRLVSSKGDGAIFSGGVLHSVVQSYMAWQNSGGGVSIRPTRSGRD